MNHYSELANVEIRNKLRSMFAFFNAEKRDGQIMAYGNRLSHYDIKTVSEACQLAVDGSKYLPSISEMLSFIQAVKQQNKGSEDTVNINRRNHVPLSVSGKILTAMLAEYSKDGLERVNNKLAEMKPSCICKNCFDSGLVHTNKKVNNNSYVFKCFCSNGKERREVFPVWHKNLESEFKIK